MGIGIGKKSLMRSCVNAPYRICRYPLGHLHAAAYALVLVYTVSWFLWASVAAAGPAAKSPVAKTVVIRKQIDPSHGMSAGNILAVFTVEVVADKASREKGLSGRDSLPPDSAMLFMLEPGRPVAFWMKDMKFPIDIIVFERSRRVIGIMKNLPPCIQCPIYSVSPHAAYALEINAGLADKYGITVGDTFVFGNE
jgi:hypothetical protein